MSKLTLLNGFELSGNLSASFVPVNENSVFDSIENLIMGTGTREKVVPDYSVYILSVMCGKGLGLSEKILLKIHFKMSNNKFEATIQANWIEDIWVNIWTDKFRAHLSSFLQSFVIEQENKMDKERLIAITELIDKLSSKSSVRIYH